MNSVKNAIRDILETFLLSIIIIFLIYQFVASMEVVSGNSMIPNYKDGERILVDRISHFFVQYQRGEVVVLTPEQEGGRHFIKRIVGIPGDFIKIYECSVYISNGEQRFKLDEFYLPNGLCTSGGANLSEGRTIQLQKNEYLVLGDNRQFSVDSRVFGPVTENRIVGRVVFVFWPPKSWGFVR